MTDPYLDLGHTDVEPDEVAADYDRVQSNLDELASTPTSAAFEQEQRERKRMGKVILALLILAIVVGYFFTFFVARDAGRTAARTEILDSTVASLVQANEVREAKGLPAIPVDAVVAELNDKGLVQAVTAAVLSQIEGDPRFRGAPGANGAPGTAGAAGLSGVDGAAGARGTDGTNGTQGPQGAQGEPGATGPEGPQGAQGTQGPPGANGEAPQSFTINGQQCTRDADNSGNYTCGVQ